MDGLLVDEADACLFRPVSPVDFVDEPGVNDHRDRRLDERGRTVDERVERGSPYGVIGVGGISKSSATIVAGVGESGGSAIIESYIVLSVEL